MTTPSISVVMPTHNRAKMLPATLRALAGQTVAPDAYEVILVADGCTDETSAAVAGVRSELPYSLHFIEQPGQGAAAARNRGVEQAAAPLILFLDDDMDAGPTLIEAHLAEHAAAPGSLVLGYFPIPFGLVKDDPFACPAREWWDAGFAARRKPEYRFGFRDFCTGNISLPTELFRAAGGFYQRIRSASGEDWELGYRLLKMGARFRFAERALSLHQDFTSLGRALGRTRLEGLAHVHTVQRHPELAWCFNLHRLSRIQAFPFTVIWRFLWTHPAAADMAAKVLKGAVVTTWRLGLRSLMYKLYRGLAGHAYWRGVHAGLGSLGAWERLMQDAPLEPEDAAEVDIDLAADRTRLETKLGERAESAKLWWNGSPIGRIRPVPGAERLSAIHVRDAVFWSFTSHLLAKVDVPKQWQLVRRQTHPTGIAPDRSDVQFARARVAEFDLCAPDHVWGLEGFASLQLLVRNSGRPVANITLPLRTNTAVLSADELLRELGRRGLRPDDSARVGQRSAQPPVSVIVCTKDRPHALRRCLRALHKLDYGVYEVVVVDSASASPETAEVVSQTPFRYVREERRGINWARNRGIAESQHEIIAFVDEAAVVDRSWLAAIIAAFEDPAVRAVTGLVLPAELHFPAQHLFERYGGMSKGMERRDLDGSQMSADQIVAAHRAGVGVNMAFRRVTFDQVGLFDTALDAGTPSNGGGDLDIFHRVLVAGRTLRYEPTALVWHYSWRDPEQLRKQLYNNGRAFGVYLLKVLRTRTVPRSCAVRYATVSWLGGWLVARLLKTVTRRERFPVRFVLAELWGATHAFWAYGATYRADRNRRALSALPQDSMFDRLGAR